MGSNGSEPALTNDGTMTLSSTAQVGFDGDSSLTNGGTLTDNNTAADSIGLSAGGFTVTGGTICGTAPSLNSGPLTFSGTPTAGPNCTSGTQDQIQARTGTDALSGNIPAGYTVVVNSGISTAASLTNNGAVQLAGGVLTVASGTTFTNSGSFDVASSNGTIDASTTTGGAFTTTSSGSFTIEGTLSVGSNGSEPVLSNDGTMTLGTAAALGFDGNSSLTNGGTLTDNNTAADSIGLSAGGLTVTGGTICGTAPSLNSGPLTFSSAARGRAELHLGDPGPDPGPHRDRRPVGEHPGGLHGRRQLRHLDRGVADQQRRSAAGGRRPDCRQHARPSPTAAPSTSPPATARSMPARPPAARSPRRRAARSPSRARSRWAATAASRS